MSSPARSHARTITARLQLVPPVRAVVEHLIQQIESGQYKQGDRLPTIREMSDQFDLSIRGISQAIEQLETLGMVERIHGSGCYVRSAQAPATSVPTESDSVYLFGMKDRPSVMEQIVQPVVRAVQSAGLFAVLIDTSLPDEQVPSEAELRAAWERRPPRGIIVKDARAKTLQLVERACPAGTRLVAVFQSRTRANRNWHKVEPDEFAAYRMAAQWLVKQGHQSIGLVLPENRMSATPHLSEADQSAPIDAVQEVVRLAGEPVSYSVHVNPVSPADPYGRGLSHENLEKMSAWLRGKGAPTGVIIATWRSECMPLAAAMAGKRIGKDLAVVGVGDDQPARDGRFPCVSMCHQRVAAKAVELILADDKVVDQVIQHLTLPPEFVEVVPAANQS